MKFNSEIFNTFDDGYDLGKFLGHLIEEEIDKGKELRDWIENIYERGEEVNADELLKHINYLNILTQNVALAVGFVLGRDFGLEHEPPEVQMIRNKLKASGIYGRILGTEAKREKVSLVEKVAWAKEALAKEKDMKN